MILGTQGASLLGNLLTKILSGKGTVRAGEGTIELVMVLQLKKSSNSTKSFNKF